MQVDEHSKKEGAFALLLDLKDRRKAVCAVEQEVLPNGRRVVLLATPGALYVVAGGNSLESVFARWVKQKASNCFICALLCYSNHNH